MKHAPILFLLFIDYISFSQNERQFINSAITEKFLCATPLKKLSLTRWDVTQKTYGYLNELKEHVDTSVFFSIIKNIHKLDTSIWRQNEFDSTIIVKSKSESLNLDSVLKGESTYTKKKVRYFKNLIRKYNASSPDKRLIISYSRPVFDSSGDYAIISYAAPRSGFGILIYHFTEGRWKDLGCVICGSY